MLPYSEIIPNDLFLPILCSLPPKSLIRFTAVSQLWNRKIKSPSFISKHLNKTLSITNNDHESQLLLLRLDDRGVGLCHVYMDKENDKELQECERFDFPFGSDFTYFEVIGSSNGVICLFDHGSYTILLWNPSIRKYLRLPRPLLYVHPSQSYFPYQIDFGFDSTTHDFKVVKFARQIVREVEVYSLINGSWRIIAGVNRANGRLKCKLWKPWRSNGETCSVNDSLHWIAYHQNNSFHLTSLILVFNLKSEVFHEFSLPHCHGSVDSWSIHEYGKSSIAAFDSKDFVRDIWVMKEYGIENSWAKVWSFDPLKMEVLKTLIFRKNREILEGSESGNIMALELDLLQGDYLEESRSCVRRTSVHKHVQSLILFDKGQDVPTPYPATEEDIYAEDFWYTILMQYCNDSDDDNRGLKRCKRSG